MTQYESSKTAYNETADMFMEIRLFANTINEIGPEQRFHPFENFFTTSMFNMWMNIRSIEILIAACNG